MSRRRSSLTTILAVLTPLLVVFATLSTWAHFEVLAPDALGRHARDSLQEPAVRDELADEITQRVAASDPRLAAAEPVVRRAAEILITSRQFADLVEIALQQVRRSALEGAEVSGTRLVDLEAQLRQTLEVVDPSIADRVPRNWDTSLIDLRSDAPVPTSFRVAEEVGRFWWAACVLAAAAAIGWVASAYNRRRVIAALGAVFAVAGLALIVGREVAGSAVAGSVEGTNPSRAVRAAFDVTTHGAYRIGVAYLVVGAVVLAASLTSSVLPRLLRDVIRRLRPATQLPTSSTARVAWSASAVAIGVVLAVASPRVGPVVAVAAGVVATFAGVRVLVSTLPSTSPAPARVEAIPAVAPDSTPPRARAPRLTILLSCVLVTLMVALVIKSDRGGTPASPADENTPKTLVCNGHAELCDRRVDQVTFGGTHNSMSSTDYGFLFAEQTGTITRQLEGGARLLLLDTHYGIPSSTGLVLTDLVFNDRAALVRRYGEDTVASIERLRSTVAPTSARPSLYLCHSFCELGALPASSAFAEIRTFLAKNPSEVVVLMIQDETETADTVRALQLAGLDQLAFTHEAEKPWPTLGEMVRGGTPLIIFSQRAGGDPPWFLPLYSLVQDNTFSARSVNDLSCAANRGPIDAPLLLVNHWIAKRSPDVSDAARVNDRTFLLDQLRRCQEERGQRANFVAVDFWQQGGLIAAVDELNLGSSP